MTEPSVTIHPGDNRESLRRLIEQGVRVHSVVTDPPYGLVSIQKRFGKEGAKAARTDKNDGSFARLSGGFMGKAWDGTGIERDPEFWKLIYDILLPGGYVFAFSGSRTGHWQACAMEMAGFIMHPMHGWVFGSGFPKAHGADRAVDIALGLWNPRTKGETYSPQSEEALGWEGWAHGTQSQKPALEPIYLAQKPFSEKTCGANLLQHGVGAINIDACRVPSEGGKHRNNEASQDRRYDDRGVTNFAAKPGPRGGDPMGRHPANLLLDGSPEVVAMFPKSSVTGKRSEKSKAASVEGTNWLMDNHQSTEYTDSGSAARFFHQFGPDTLPLFYNGKAAKADRAGSKHPTVKPIALMRYLIRHITPPGGTVLDPFAGSGTTGVGAKFEGVNCILMEAEPEYVDFLRQRFGQVPTLDPELADLLGEALPAESTVCDLSIEELLG